MYGDTANMPYNTVYPPPAHMYYVIDQAPIHV